MKLIKNDFYFIRHGEADYTGDPLWDDTADIPLTHQGKIQAQTIRSVIDSLSIRTICVSPLRRALETKDIISQNLSCQTIIIEELRECTTSIWSQMVELEENPHINPVETVHHFMERAIAGINHALKHPGPVLIVAHGGIHWAMCHHMNLKNHEKKIGNCLPVHFYLSEDQEWRARII